MPRPSRIKAVLTVVFGLGLVVLLLALFFMPSNIRLEVTAVKTEKTVFSTILDSDRRFTLYYHHSVNNLPIWEVHSVDKNGRIFIEEERFISFNAGMGHWKGHGRHVTRNGKQVLEGIHKPIDNFLLRVGSKKVSHTVITGKKKTNLSLLVSGQAVRFDCRPVSYFESFFQSLF